MKTHIENSSRLDILGNGPSQRKIFDATLKQWRQKLGYYSIFATVPALLATHVPVAHSDEGKRPEASVAGQGVRLRKTLDMSRSNPALLKRQSEFLLPHQQGNFALLAPLAGNDDCPGRTIPGGTYTAAAPFVASGDTTGANNTVDSCYFFYSYGDIPVHGPDHIYTFTLTGRGPNPQLQISASSSTYRPAIYILNGGNGCTAGPVINFLDLVWGIRSADAGGAVRIDGLEMNSLPLNVPLHLFVDSPDNDASGSGPYVLRMQDVTIAPAVAGTNSIDVPEFFVRQHYLDFLAREPEQSGMEAWLRVLSNCPVGDNQCLHQARLTTSAAFFGSPEFQLKGYFVFRFYKVAFARLPTYDEISSDMQSVSRLTPAEVYAAKAAFTDAFVQRQEFVNTFSGLSNADYVAALTGRYGLSAVTAPDPAQPEGAGKVTLTSAELVDHLNAGSLTRAQVLRAVADSDQLLHLEFNPAFVAMQYYGYLRRAPEVTGYNDWLNYLNAHPEDFREMVRGFVDSIEYRSRFGQP